GVRVATGDVNGDGRADFVYTVGAELGPDPARRYETVHVLLQTPAGDLTPTPLIYTNVTTVDVQIVDVDGDGLNDIAMLTVPNHVSFDADRSSVIYQKPDHTLTDVTPLPLDYVFAIADLNGDTRPDLLLTGNPATGPFQTFASYRAANGAYAAPVLVE